MGLPALLRPEAWVQRAVPVVDPAEAYRLTAEIHELLDDVRRNRPLEGTQEEKAVLLRVAVFGFSAMRLLGPAFVQVFRENLNQALADLVREELAAAELERKLALRQIEQAVHRYGVIMESVGAELRALPTYTLATLLAATSEQLTAGDVPLSEDDRVVLRFQLDVLVALAVLDAPLEELTFWAFRAITDARRVEAMRIAVRPAGLQGELARVRARRAWKDWDSAELAEELAPWPSPTR